MQDTLTHKTFVQSLYGYKRDFLQHGKTPHEQIIIFDEAQRAWDAQKMNSHLSEPDVIIQIAKTNKPWSVVIGLIGDGQEIHLGEESGLSLWNTAIQSQAITVHAKHENRLFSNAEHYEQHEHLHLNCSLRSHAALKYYAFVNALLAGDIEQAYTLKVPLEQQCYPIFITNDLQRAKEKAYIPRIIKRTAFFVLRVRIVQKVFQLFHSVIGMNHQSLLLPISTTRTALITVKPYNSQLLNFKHKG